MKKTAKEYTVKTTEIKVRNDGVYLELDGVVYKRMPAHSQKVEGLDAYILFLFEDLFKRYTRRDAKAQAYRTWVKKFKGCKTKDEVTERARAIFKVVLIRQKQFEAENRALQYYPMLSTLLNKEVL